MATHREAESLTGLEVGGISALGLLDKGFEVYADESILALREVYVSAGGRGINLGLNPEDLVRVTRARVVRAARAGGTGRRKGGNATRGPIGPNRKSFIATWTA